MEGEGLAGGHAHHDLAEFVVAGTDILHEHLKGRELVLGGQRVELLLLHFLQLHTVPQLPHQLHPQPGLEGHTDTVSVPTRPWHGPHARPRCRTQSVLRRLPSSAAGRSSSSSSSFSFCSSC